MGTRRGTLGLLAGLAVRPPTMADTESIWRFVAAHNERILGFADVTVDDIADELDEPGFDPTTDAWLVHRPDGEVAGYGWAVGKGGSGEVDVDAIADDEAVSDWLWEQVLSRGTAIADAAHQQEATLDIGVYRADERQRERAAANDFRPGTTFHRMRIDHGGRRVDPALPRGVTIRRGTDDLQARRDAHAVLVTAFAGQFGFVARSFEEWHDAIDASSTSDWSQLSVAHHDGVPVAMLLGNDQFVEDEGCGYIARVGVLPEARGRGFAKHLLLEAFAAGAANGRTGTILHVDTNNPTPALGLYEGVGMRAVLVLDIWRRTIPLPAASSSPDGADR